MWGAAATGSAGEMAAETEERFMGCLSTVERQEAVSVTGNTSYAVFRGG
jgi:hypothetical protein